MKIDINTWINLASLLRDIILETEIPEAKVEVPNSIILSIASQLSKDFESGNLQKQGDGMFYYSGMTDDYCGEIYRLIE